MNDAGQMVLNWLADQPVAMQIGLSLVLVLLIVPAIFAAIVAAITRIEERVERLLSPKSESSPVAGTSLPEVPGQSRHQAGAAQDSEVHAEPTSQNPAHSSKGHLRRIHPAE